MITRSRSAAGLVAAAAVVVALSGCTLVEEPAAPPEPTEQASSTAAPADTADSADSADERTAGWVPIQLDESTGEPVRYAACRPVPYVTNLDGAPDGVDALVAEAVATISEATGLQFVDEGTTDEQAVPERDAEVAQYGDGWAPVLIAWTDPDAVPELDGDTVGLAGSTAYSDASGLTAYVSGDVLLDGPDLSAILEDEPNGEAQVRAVVAHELGHLVGLDHVDDPTQLMFAEDNPEVTEPAAGDLRGLAVMGQGPCAEDLATP